MTSFEIRFEKFEGCGNDYAYVNLLGAEPSRVDWFRANARALALRISDRNFGVGSDGLVLLVDDGNADCRMLMFNADGSQGETCGNALRCIGRILDRSHPRPERRYEVATQLSLSSIEVSDGDAGPRVAVDMGEARVGFDQIPLLADCVEVLSDPVVDESRVTVAEVEIALGGEGRKARASVLSMGNPHCVVFLADSTNHWISASLDGEGIEQIGPELERAPCFPEGANVEFVAMSPEGLVQRTWERGSGETLACGSGACAVAVAAVSRGLVPAGDGVRITLRGGALDIEVARRIRMSGPARRVFSGSFEVRQGASTCYDGFVL